MSLSKSPNSRGLVDGSSSQQHLLALSDTSPEKPSIPEKQVLHTFFILQLALGILNGIEWHWYWMMIYLSGLSLETSPKDFKRATIQRSYSSAVNGRALTNVSRPCFFYPDIHGSAHVHWRHHNSCGFIMKKCKRSVMGKTNMTKHGKLSKTENSCLLMGTQSHPPDHVLDWIWSTMFMIWWLLAGPLEKRWESRVWCVFDVANCCSNMPNIQSAMPTICRSLRAASKHSNSTGISIQYCDCILENSLGIERKATKEPSRHRQLHGHKMP